MAEEIKKEVRTWRDVNIWSRKFLLTLIAVLVIGYGLYHGELAWDLGTKYITVAIAFYCLSEGIADHGNPKQIQNLIKLLFGIGSFVLPPSAPPTGKEPGEKDEEKKE